MSISNSLSEEQKELVEAPPDIKALVTAGSGTGKTYVLVAKLIELIEKHDLSPGREILVLSFSRAAVKEIRRRTRILPGNVRFVRSRTFDSFGTLLLSEIDPEGDWESGFPDYDGRIKRATELLKNDDAAREFISRYSHIFVDELQDLVSVRSEMVMALLKIADCGFTLLGDPAQGIYNFQLPEEERLDGSAKLYRWLNEYFGDELKRYTFSKNHRAKTDSAKKALWAGPELNKPEPDYKDIKYRLDNVVLRLNDIGEPQNITTLLRKIEGRTAFLCRTNGQALIISRELWKHGIQHSYQRSATDRVLPSWIGTIFSGANTDRIGKSSFEEKYTQLYKNDVSLAWRELKRIEGGNAMDSLDLTKLAEHIRIGMVPDDIYETSEDNIIVSTIHRAKGMEFERVIITDKSSSIREDEFDLPGETKLLYVGLSRPISELYWMSEIKVSGYIRIEKRTDRWVRQYNIYKYVDIEVRGNDVHRLDPAGAFGVKDSDPGEIQKYIRAKVDIGDEAVLTRVRNTESNHPPYLYEIKHNEFTVGIMSESFSWDLFNTLKHNSGWTVHWPIQIDGTRVEAIDTVAGTLNSGKQAGLGDPDIWLRVRVVGFGTMKFEKTS